MLNILIVDDSVLIRSMVAAALKQLQVRSIEAETGAEALSIAAHSPIDLILLDVELEDSNGQEVCARLKAMPQTAHIPIIMMSGYDEAEFADGSPQHTPDFFLQKPFTIQDIQQLVQRALSYSDTQ